MPKHLRFWAAFRVELRLLCVHWSFPLLYLASIVLLLSLMRENDLGTAQYVLRGENSSFKRIVWALAPFFALLLAAISASRSARSRFDTLEETFPTGAEVLLGRWLAVLTASLSLLIVPLIIAGRQGPLSSFLEVLPGFLLNALIIFGFAMAGSWWVVSRLGVRRWVYPLLMGGWVFFVIGVKVLENAYNGPNADPSILGLLGVLFDVTCTWENYTELWGQFGHENLPLWFNLVYGGLGAFWLGLIVWRHLRRRYRRPFAGLGLGVLAAVVLAGLGAQNVIAMVDGRYAQADAEQTYHNRLAKELPFTVYSEPQQEIQLVPIAVEAYELEADLSKPAQPQFHAPMRVQNTSSEPIDKLRFTLYYGLTIKDANLPFDRLGDFLAFNLDKPLAPRATQIVELSYAGPL